MSRNAAGLKVQVLGRIEGLEAQAREREELLAELAPAMEARRYDTGAVKAVMGGKAGRLNAHLHRCLSLPQIPYNHLRLALFASPTCKIF